MADPDVQYDNSLGTAGKFEPEGMIHSWLSSLLPSIFHPGGTIKINPNNTANIQTTIQHEKVHSILDSLNDGKQLQQLNAQNPFYKQLASKIALEPGTDANIEAPAYTATGESKQFDIPPILSNEYNQYLQKQLFALDPKLGAAYSKVSTPLPVPQQ